MRRPPTKIFLTDIRKPIFLLAYVEYHNIMSEKDESYFKDWFIGFYTLPNKETSKHFIALVNNKGDKVRYIRKAGDCFEHAIIVFSGLYNNVSVLDIHSSVYCVERTLFKGKLIKRIYAYKKELFKTKKRLDNLKHDYLKAIHDKTQIEQ